MSAAPSANGSSDDSSADLGSAVAALGPRISAAPVKAAAGHSNRRLAVAGLLGAQLIGAVLILSIGPSHSRTAADDVPADPAYDSAHSGSCLVWRPETPQRLSFAQCSSPHLFEVAKVVEPDDDDEPCSSAVQKYLGADYDPDSRFTVRVLRPDGADEHRKSLCGLQLPGPDGRPIPFRGQVAGQDQSRVWPPGTCIRSESGTLTPVDCVEPHALEALGPVDLGEHFHEGPPADADQEQVLHPACMKFATAYLAPKPLSASNWILDYHPISPASWSAGSRQALCALAPRAGGLMTGSVKANTAAPEEHPSPEATEPHPVTTATTTATTSAVPSPTSQSSSAPSTSTATTSSPSASSTPSETTAPPPVIPPTVEAPPQNSPQGPAVEIVTPSEGPAQQVIQIPGLPAITLPAPMPG